MTGRSREMTILRTCPDRRREPADAGRPPTFRNDRHPLVGRIAALWLGPRDAAPGAQRPGEARVRRTASCSHGPETGSFAAARSARLPPTDPDPERNSPASTAIGGSAFRPCTRCSIASTTRSSTGCGRIPRPGRRVAVPEGPADQLGPDRQDPCDRMDAGAAAEPDAAICDARLLVGHPGRGLCFKAFGRPRAASCSPAFRARRKTTTPAPYAITEEFTAVYRLHSLIPDEFSFRRHSDDTEVLACTLADLFLGGTTPLSTARWRSRTFSIHSGPAIRVHRCCTIFRTIFAGSRRSATRTFSRPGGDRHSARSRARRAALLRVPPACCG